MQKLLFSTCYELIKNQIYSKTGRSLFKQMNSGWVFLPSINIAVLSSWNWSIDAIGVFILRFVHTYVTQTLECSPRVVF